MVIMYNISSTNGKNLYDTSSTNGNNVFPNIAIFRMCYGENGTVKLWQIMYLDITIP